MSNELVVSSSLYAYSNFGVVIVTSAIPVAYNAIIATTYQAFPRSLDTFSSVSLNSSSDLSHSVDVGMLTCMVCVYV